MKKFLHCFKLSVFNGQNSNDVPCYSQHSGKSYAGIPWSPLGCRLVEDTGWYWAQMPCNWWQKDPRGDHRWRSRWLGVQAEGCAKVLSHLLPLIAVTSLGHPLHPAGQLLSSCQWGTCDQATPAASEHMQALSSCSQDRFPYGSGSCCSSQKIPTGWNAVLPQILCVIWLCGAHPVFYPTLGRWKGQFSELQDYEEAWNWFRKNKAVMTEEKNLLVILQQESPWVLFAFCTYWYLFVQPLPNISTAPFCFISPGTVFEPTHSDLILPEIGCHDAEPVTVTASIANMAQQPLKCP